jgi:hypothetical protein
VAPHYVCCSPRFIAPRWPQNLAVTYILGVSYASEGAEVARAVVIVLEKGFDTLQSFGRLSPWSKDRWHLNIDIREARQHSSRGGAGKKVTIQNSLCTSLHRNTNSHLHFLFLLAFPLIQTNQGVSGVERRRDTAMLAYCYLCIERFLNQLFALSGLFEVDFIRKRIGI